MDLDALSMPLGARWIYTTAHYAFIRLASHLLHLPLTTSVMPVSYQ